MCDAISYIQPGPYIVDNTNYDNKYETPVLTPGKAFILGYTNEKKGIYDATDNNVIIFDDFTTATKFVDFKFKVKSSAMKILISKDSSKYNIKYFYYLLNTIQINSDTHKRFWISEYEDYYVKIPVFWYQSLIVDFLDVLFYKIDLIAKENTKLINIIEVTKTKILDEIFSNNSSYKSYYEICVGKLEKYSNSITKGTTPTSYGFKYLNSGIPFIKVENVSNYMIMPETIKCFISEEANNFQKRSQLKEGDILFSIAGTIGKLCLVNSNNIPANTNQAFAIISGYQKNINPYYLLYYLEWSKTSDSKVESHGLGMNNATLAGLRNLEIWFPKKISDQEIIVNNINKIFNILDSMIS